MLDTLRALIADSLPTVPPMDIPAAPGDIRVAACALLLEMAYADGRMTPEERKSITGTLTRHFGVDGRGAEELMQLAEAQLAETTEATSYTQQLVAEYDRDQRIMLAEMLREVASADGWLDQHEEMLLQRMETWLQVDRTSLRTRPASTTAPATSDTLPPSSLAASGATGTATAAATTVPHADGTAMPRNPAHGSSASPAPTSATNDEFAIPDDYLKE